MLKVIKQQNLAVIYQSYLYSFIKKDDTSWTQ